MARVVVLARPRVRIRASVAAMISGLRLGLPRVGFDFSGCFIERSPVSRLDEGKDEE
jgi:hypothetical protein